MTDYPDPAAGGVEMLEQGNGLTETCRIKSAEPFVDKQGLDLHSAGSGHFREAQSKGKAHEKSLAARKVV